MEQTFWALSASGGCKIYTYVPNVLLIINTDRNIIEQIYTNSFDLFVKYAKKMLIARNEICMIPDCYVWGSIICFLLCMYIAYATLCLNVYIIGKFIYFFMI